MHPYLNLEFTVAQRIVQAPGVPIGQACGNDDNNSVRRYS